MEAKPWELSGARVGAPPSAVKEQFGQFLKNYLSMTYVNFPGFVRLSSGFLRVAFHSHFYPGKPPVGSSGPIRGAAF
jgi:hypothetical protein